MYTLGHRSFMDPHRHKTGHLSCRSKLTMPSIMFATRIFKSCQVKGHPRLHHVKSYMGIRTAGKKGPTGHPSNPHRVCTPTRHLRGMRHTALPLPLTITSMTCADLCKWNTIPGLLLEQPILHLCCHFMAPSIPVAAA